MTSTVVLRYLDGKDKITLLNEVIAKAGLDRELEAVRKKSGKTREDVCIVIKPNASMFVRRDDDGVTTDPILVLGLVSYLHEKGYTNICVAESSNAYALTYSERNPITVMTAMGLNGGVHRYTPAKPEMTAHVVSQDKRLLPYRLVDLGAETEALPSEEMPDGKIELSSCWVHADFRISFAKFKTHVYGGYTLLIKNTFGCLPKTNKMWHYHRPTGCSKPTLVQLKKCPVHFGIIDGIIAADGCMGVKWDRATPKRPGFILAGRNIAETERAACRIMGVKVKRSLMTKDAMEFLAEPSVLEGEIRPLKSWWNVPGAVISGFPMTESYYRYYQLQQTVTDGMGTPPFKRKPMGVILTWLLVLPVLMYAFHRRDWVIRTFRDYRLRWQIRSAQTAPRRIRKELDRLDTPELTLLKECLESNNDEQPQIFGHNIKANGAWYALPDSTFSRLVRIPEIVDALKTPEEMTRCIEEIKARLVVLKKNARIDGQPFPQQESQTG